MKSEWTKMKLSDIAEFNPREIIKKGGVAKKISMFTAKNNRNFGKLIKNGSDYYNE